ncbi:HSF_DOMAIN domain-containing protein [Nephila pilipes]|uniref:HSF_DOMAIN domain-containing protein n=1 Tax=Nephila pilipes TaxID=299642 RepID=A0A8X6QHC8_NEPPI|nr:HSF_DOMAIN domain-containing protein [Nephila pilipes]
MNLARELSDVTFPHKLFILASSSQISSIRWTLDGNTLQIDSSTLLQECAPFLIFNVKNNQHVIRRLSHYNFKKIKKKSKIWEFRHPYFKSGREDLLHFIKRKPSHKKKGHCSSKVADLSRNQITLDGNGPAETPFPHSEVDSTSILREGMKQNCSFLEDSDEGVQGATKAVTNNYHLQYSDESNISPTSSLHSLIIDLDYDSTEEITRISKPVPRKKIATSNQYEKKSSKLVSRFTGGKTVKSDFSSAEHSLDLNQDLETSMPFQSLSENPNSEAFYSPTNKHMFNSSQKIPKSKGTFLDPVLQSPDKSGSKLPCFESRESHASFDTIFPTIESNYIGKNIHSKSTETNIILENVCPEPTQNVSNSPQQYEYEYQNRQPDPL